MVLTGLEVVGFAGCSAGVGLVFGRVCQRNSDASLHRIRSDSTDQDLIVFFTKDCSLVRRGFPKSEIPKLAACVKLRSVRNGECIVQKGEVQKELIFIYHGEALIDFQSDGTNSRLKLIRGSHWGDGSLLRSTGSGATLWANATGGHSVQLLCLSAEDFNKLGFSQVDFLKRPGITIDTERKDRLGDADIDFVANIIMETKSLRDQLARDEDSLHKQIGDGLQLQKYNSGDTIVKQEAYVMGAYFIRSGQVINDYIRGNRDMDGWSKPIEYADGNFWNAIREVLQRNEVAEDVTRTRTGKIMTIDKVSDLVGDELRSLFPISVKVNLERGNSGEDGHKRIGLRRQREKEDEVRRAFPTTMQLGPGNVFGDTSLFHRTRHLSTVRATTAVELYFLPRDDFRRCLKRERDPQRQKDVQNVIRLLDDLKLLSGMLKVQRRELAKNYIDLVTFPPDEVIIKQGCRRRGLFWYVIQKGSAVVVDETKAIEDEELCPVDSFGLRTILMDRVPDLTVKAGPHGLTCVLFEGEFMKSKWIKQAIPEETMRHICWDALGGCKQARLSRTLGSADQYAARRTNLDPKKLDTIAFLGNGQFGLVYLQEDPIDGKRFALKRMSKGLVAALGGQAQMSTEKDLTCLLSGSPFTINYHCSWRDDEFIYILTDAEMGGDLENLLNTKALSESDTLFYIACVTEAIAFLHDRFVVYGDLKPANVMLGSDGYARLGDFGLSRFRPRGRQIYRFAGTKEYAAPEMWQTLLYGERSAGYGFEADWFALGVMTYELLSEGELPFGNDEEHMKNCSPFLVAPIREKIDAPINVLDFIRKLLKKDPKARLGATGFQSVQDHPWLSQMDFEKLRERKIKAPPPLVRSIEVGNLEKGVEGLWDDNGHPVLIPFKKYRDEKLQGPVEERTGTIQYAIRRCRETVQVDTVPSDRAGVLSFHTRAGGQIELKNGSDGREEGPGWTTYKCLDHLYVRYNPDNDRLQGWDENFQLLR